MNLLILSSVKLDNQLLQLIIMNKKQTQRQFISGLVAGFVSVTICNPLDVARTRMNIMGTTHYARKYVGFFSTLKTIFKEEGWRGYYKGYSTTVISIPLFNSLYFPIYTNVKHHLAERNHSKLSSVLGATISAGFVSNIITNPLWVIRTRLMVEILRPKEQQYQNINSYQIIRQMLREEGVLSLYKGLSVSLFGLLHACIYFPIYQKVKQFLNPDEHKMKSLNVLVAAIISKCIASSATYPHIVVRTLLHDHRSKDRLSLISIVKSIHKQHGIKGFYLGLKPDLMRVVPSNAIIFISYEYLKRLWQ